MYEKSTLLSVETGNHLKGLIAEAADEASELVVVYDAEREDGRGDTRTERIPHGVALLLYRGGPAYYANMRNQQLVPASCVLVYFEPEVVAGEETVPRDELKVLQQRCVLQ